MVNFNHTKKGNYTNGHKTIKKNRGCDGRDPTTGEGRPGTIQKEIKR